MLRRNIHPSLQEPQSGQRNHIALPSYTVLVKGIGKAGSCAWLSSFLQQPSILAVWQMHFLWDVLLLLLPGTGRNALSDLHCLATRGAAAGASYAAAAPGSHLSNFPPCASVALAAKGWGWTCSMMWYKPSGPLVYQGIFNIWAAPPESLSYFLELISLTNDT